MFASSFFFRFSTEEVIACYHWSNVYVSPSLYRVINAPTKLQPLPWSICMIIDCLLHFSWFTYGNEWNKNLIYASSCILMRRWKDNWSTPSKLSEMCQKRKEKKRSWRRESCAFYCVSPSTFQRTAITLYSRNISQWQNREIRHRLATYHETTSRFAFSRGENDR